MKLSLDSKLTLNKHYGRTLNEIICGFSSNMQTLLVKGFLNEYVNFFSNKCDFDIPLPNFFKNSFYKKRIINNYDFSNSYIKFNEKLNYLSSIFMIDSNRVLIYPGADLDDKIKISHFIKSTLTADFENELQFYGSYHNRQIPFFSNMIKSCFADPNYISWCINNLENFAIDETAIEKEYEISSLLKMDVIPINHKENDTRTDIQTKYGCLWFDESNSIICKPILHKTQFKFAEKIKEVNYEHLRRLERKSIINSSFYYDERNWLRDAAGTDDPETMNDVYWNLD